MDQNSWIAGLVRAVLAAVGGIAVSKGYTDESTMTTLIGAVTVLFTGAWSIFSKMKKK